MLAGLLLMEVLLLMLLLCCYHLGNCKTRKWPGKAEQVVCQNELFRKPCRPRLIKHDLLRCCGMLPSWERAMLPMAVRQQSAFGGNDQVSKLGRLERKHDECF